MEILFISCVTIWSDFQNPVTYSSWYTHTLCSYACMYVYMYVCTYVCMYRIAQFIDEGNIDGLASLRNLNGKILTDSILDNQY